MSGRIDRGQIAAQANIVAVVGSRIALKQKGREHVGLCPFHDDSTPSFCVSPVKNAAFCMSCKWSGDAIKFVIEHDKVDFLEAVKRLGINPEDQAVNDKPSETWEPIVPAPVAAPSMAVACAALGATRPLTSKQEPWTAKWKYLSADGRIAFYVMRFDPPGQRKQIRPLTYGTLNGQSGWYSKAAGDRRPLYCLPDIVSRTTAPILVVEGEKAADAARALYPELVVTTWSGGSNAWQKSDWTTLRARDVYLWPDNDEAGRVCMASIREHLETIAASIRTVNIPDGMPAKWDLADADWTPDHAADRLEEWLGPRVAKEHKATATEIHIEAAPSRAVLDYGAPHFRVLGTDGNSFFVFNNRNCRVFEIKMGSVSKYTLPVIAPLDYWERAHPAKGGCDWGQAADKFQEQCYAMGTYDPRKLRGRGCWIDEGRYVLHTGTQLNVDGSWMAIKDHRSTYAYEAAVPMKIAPDDALTRDQSSRLVEIASLLSWSSPLDHEIFAGWLFSAIVCGAMPWRSHLYLTGPAGAGKSTAVQVVQLALGDYSIGFQGTTTEAAIRQVAGRDARPIVMDEAETENKPGRDRIQAILELARQASSADGPDIVKGGRDGRSMTYRIRSCFLFASIAPSVEKSADASRITILRMTRKRSHRDFNYIQDQIQGTLTPEFRGGLIARAARLAPIMLKNFRTFAAAGERAFGSRRAADTIAFPMTGLYSLTRDGLVTQSDAEAWLANRKFDDQQEIVVRDNAERTVFEYLLEQKLHTEGERRNYERTIAELIPIAYGHIQDERVTPSEANFALRRNGFIVDRDTSSLYVARAHSQIVRLLSLSDWPLKAYANLLMQIPQAGVGDQKRFGHQSARSIVFPMRWVLEQIGSPLPTEDPAPAQQPLIEDDQWALS